MEASPERRVDQARERFALQDYYGAIHLLEELVAVGHTYADAEHMLGLCYSLVGQPEKALAHLDRSLELNPHYVEALVHRALVLNDLGREQEATDSLRRAGQIGGKSRLGFPSHLAQKLANLHAHLAEAYIEAGGMREAIGQYQAALALGPDFHDLRYKLGRLLLQAGRVLEAREQFEIIVRSRPTFQDAAAMLGLACYLSGDGLSARVVWQDCRRRRPEDPRVEAYLAMLDRGDLVGTPPELVARASGRPSEP
jgi:tetratricopeptide (TPR) repeat protein